MLIDYLSKEQAFSLGIEEDTESDQIVFRGNRTLSNITFVNFPSITFEEMSLENCTFKDCREVFAHVEELSQMGLNIPQITLLMRMLRDRGIDIPTNAYTVEEAQELLMQFLSTNKAGGEKQ